MKKVTIVFLIVYTACLHSFGQNCDKVIEWNLDSGIAQKELPYNQSIYFRLKSKSIPLDKVSVVLLLEHHGKMTAEQSARYHADHGNIPQKFYILTKGEYDKDNKILPVSLVENPSEKRPQYVLQPSKRYSLFLLTSEPDAPVNKLLENIKKYIDALRSQDPGAGDLRNIIDWNYNYILNRLDSSPIRSVFFSSRTVDTLLASYERNIYPKDSLINIAKNEVKVFNDQTKGYDCDLPSNVSILIEKSLSQVAEKEGCISQLPCTIDKCTLYKYMIALQNRKKFPTKKDSTVIGNFIMGLYTLSDLTNPLFMHKKEPELATKINNIDSLIIQFSNIKIYLNSSLINDCKIYSCCDSAKKFYSSSINEDIVNYTSCVDSILGRLRISRVFLQNLTDLITARSERIKNMGFSFPILQFSSGNTFTYGLEPRNKLVIMPVLGYAYYGFQKSFSSFTPYTGILVSFAPLDDEVPFSLLKHKTLAQRLGFLFGVTLSSFKEDKKRDNLFSNGTNLMFGLGFKLSHVLNLNGGIVVFKKEDINPFVSTKKLTTTPFLSLSLNLKLQSLFSGLIGLLPNK